MEERLQKILAEAGICSRRKAEVLIGEGRVKVNGVLVTELGTKADPERDEITRNGKPVRPVEKLVYYMLHKPVGYVTTAKDQFDRPTVLDLLYGVKERVYPVGRLDYDTAGLLLLTNDGELTYKLTHPSHLVEKVYEARLFGRPTAADVQAFARGLVVEGRKLAPAKLEILEDEGRFCHCKITIVEGRNRQVRKMCEAIKHPVDRLSRVATGELKLGDLEKGKFRALTAKEVKYLKSL